MPNKILILGHKEEDYGKAVKGLGCLINDYRFFFRSPKEFILVLFTGGTDVTPSFYNDTSPFGMCTSSLSRDKFEKTIFQHALTNNIPMIGICRGFQFLNVMAKGRLMHHINGHGGSIHLFDAHILEKPIKVNSFHHQMVIPPGLGDAYVVGWPVDNISNVYYGKQDQAEKWEKPEVEAAIFPKINACGVQYHPEWMPTTSKGFLFFYDMANRLINWPIGRFTQLYTKDKNIEKAVDHVTTKTC